VQAARGIGLRSLSFLAADVSAGAFDRTAEAAVAPDLAELESEMEALIAEYPGDGFVLESPQKLHRIVGHVRAHYGLEPPRAPRCNAPWVSAVVESNGDVRPCFFHAPVGNLEGTTLREVLNGPRALAFREGLCVDENAICRRCVCSLYVELNEGKR
jgi:Fe-coproporphyrin III synthase